MEYTKPELNVIGAAEGLVLGDTAGNSDGSVSASSRTSSAFEFEE